MQQQFDQQQIKTLDNVALINKTSLSISNHQLESSSVLLFPHCKPKTNPFLSSN